MAYLSPKTIVVEFLRQNVSDPRGRITSKTNTISPVLGQTILELAPTEGKNMSYIDSVTVDGTPIVKWRDYYIDHKLNEITVYTAFGGTETVVIIFGETASDWIFPDKPNQKLDASAFPRMNLLIVGAPGTRLGNYESPVQTIARYQVDIWTKEKQNNQIFLIGKHKYTGEDLAEYLSYQVTKAFETGEGGLFPALYGYDPVGMPPDLPFDDELQCHHKTVEFLLSGLNQGRTS